MATSATDLPRRFGKHLIPTERVVVASRRHLAKVIEPVGTFVVSVVVVIWLELQLSRDVPAVPQLLWVPPLLLLVRAAWRLWDWSEDWFVVTDRRLMLGYGVLTRRVAMMPMRKVTDMSYNRTPMGQLLNYGEFVLESAGQDQALRVVAWLPEPDELYRLICTEIFGPDGDWNDEEDGGRAVPDRDDGGRPSGDQAWRGFSLRPGGRSSSRSDVLETDVIDRRDADEDDHRDDWDDDRGDDAADVWDEGEEWADETPADEPSPRGLRRADPRRWRRRRRPRDDRWDD